MKQRTTTPRTMPKARTIPEPYGTIAVQQMERDYLYFEANPRARCYLRPIIPGEEWPNPPLSAGTLVRVHQIRRGVRWREFLPPWRGDI